MVAVIAFAVLRFFAAARAFSRRHRGEGNETAFMAGAIEDAVQHLRVQERAMKARAEASERLSSEIIASMTSGLLWSARIARSAVSIPPGSACSPSRPTIPAAISMAS